MKAVHRGLTSGVLFCLFVLAGCAAWSPAPQFSQPYFVVETGEAKSLHALAKKQEALAPEMCRAQFLRPCVLYPCACWGCTKVEILHRNTLRK